jgi:GH15 family glucan-1,4-alpha-glucosidase
MKSFRARSTGALLTAALAGALGTGLGVSRAEASPSRTWNFLTTGNGLGFQVYDTNAHKITTFLDHPYRYIGPRPDPKSDGWPRRNLAFDVYFGLKSGWLNTPTTAGDVSYVEETSIIHAPVTLGSVTADTYFYSPFDFDGNMMVALLHAPGASDGYILLNFHLGGVAGQPQSDPDAGGESVTAIAAQMAMTETGPGGGAMVYVPIGGVDHADCQGVFDKVKNGQDLGNNQSCSGNDLAPGFQKKLGADGWWAVAMGFTENAGNAGALAKQMSDWAAGRAPDKLLTDAKAEWDAWRKPLPGGAAVCSDDEKKVWRQGEATLRMGQVREPYTSSRKSEGMMLASLPEGEWHSGWVRDGTFGVVGLARSGHLAEAKKGINFFLDAGPVGKYKSFVSNQNYRVSVVRYFGSGEEEADYSGQPTPNVETDGWGMVLWAARQYVEASGDTAWLSSNTKVGDSVYAALVNGIAKPMEANLEANGIMKADSGIWEVHDANKKHFAFTTMAAARGFCDLAALAKKAGKDADATKYKALAAKVRAAFLSSFIDQQGALGGSLEGISSNQYFDGAVAAAFTWNLLDDFAGQTATATLDVLAQLKVASGGFKRNNDGLSSYDNNEWILVDLLISNALRRAGRTAEADSYVKLVVDQAAANFYILPELYNAVPSDGAIGKYTGSIPMVGYGAGAYIMTMLDKSGLIEPNDCGDGNGATLPIVTCGGASSSSSSSGNSSGGNSGAGAGDTGASGVGGGSDSLPPYGTGACLCRAGGADDPPPAGVLLLLAGVPSALAARRRARRAARSRRPAARR